MNDISEAIVAKTKFKLPSEFLTKWIQNSSKEPMTQEEAVQEYSKSESGIRYQLIEGKIISENNLDINFEELKDYTASMIQNQMMQYGQTPEKEKLDEIISNVMSNKDETRRISEQLMREKILYPILEAGFQLMTCFRFGEFTHSVQASFSLFY